LFLIPLFFSNFHFLSLLFILLVLYLS